MLSEEKVRDHFHADARRFDAIYVDDKNPFSRWVDSVWRGVVRRRFDLTLEKFEPIEGKTFLDVGCGSGRYCLAYAQRGASRVVGVDFAQGMIDLANQYARESRVDDVCEFRAGAFPDAVPDGPFDCSSAMGFFDYIEEPTAIVRRMRELTHSTMVMSFPKANEWRAPIRRVRFKLIGCPLYLYSEERVRSLLANVGVSKYEWVELDRDYIVIGRLD